MEVAETSFSHEVGHVAYSCTSTLELNRHLLRTEFSYFYLLKNMTQHIKSVWTKQKYLS